MGRLASIILKVIIGINSIIFLIYGVGKITGFQGKTKSLAETAQLENLSPAQVMWYFLFLVKGYTYFIGLAQIIPAILLLFKKTRFIGSILYLCVVMNIFAINIFFSIIPQTLILSSLLLVNTIIILISERQKILRLLD